MLVKRIIWPVPTWNMSVYMEAEVEVLCQVIARLLGKIYEVTIVENFEKNWKDCIH